MSTHHGPENLELSLKYAGVTLQIECCAERDKADNLQVHEIYKITCDEDISELVDLHDIWHHLEEKG